MRKFLIIKWNKSATNCLLALVILGILSVCVFNFQNIIKTNANLNEPYKTYFEPERPAAGSLEEIYQDVFMTMLLPYIQEAVNDYYEKNTGYFPSVDPWQPDVLSIERPNGYRTFLFIIKLEVMPYLGAHNSIDVDHITLRVSYREVKVEKFEHIKSYPIPPWLQPLE